MNHLSSTTFILASGSPRRQEFLRALGLTYAVRVANIDETPDPNEQPSALAHRLAEGKASAVAALPEIQAGDHLVIAADTVVALGEESLGKPVDSAEAANMLTRLRNRPHQVITAVSVRQTGTNRQRTRLSITDVYMRDYTDEEIAVYIATGDPFDKAGAYAIQHPVFAPVDRVEGCVSGVIGLPLGELCDLLGEFGVNVGCALAPICRKEMGFRCCRA